MTEFSQNNALLVKKDRIVIGVSGGSDSLCLLHLLKTLSPHLELTLIIAHLNHQLRANDAQADEAFVREIAERWQLPIFVERSNIATLAAQRKQSLEEAARQIRYAFLWRVAQDVRANKIAVGHNADDQVETILMHFLRGTGLAGLRGMLPVTDIANLRLHPDDLPMLSPHSTPKLIRPLLEISRHEIERYCQEHQLSPRQDESNLDTTLFRNRLRHELIPQLKTYNPNLSVVLQHMAKVIAAEVEVLNDQLDKAWLLVIRHEAPDGIEIDRPGWLSLPLALKRSILRRAIQGLRRSLRDISFEHVERAIAVVEKGNAGAQATLPQGLMLAVGYDTFIIAPENSQVYDQPLAIPHLAQDQVLTLNLPGVTPLPDMPWQLTAEFILPGSLNDHFAEQIDPWEAYLDAGVVGKALMLRPRRPGDIFCPLGLEGHRQKVNEFMINEKIPTLWRNHIPLLVSDDQILWICGYRLDERARLRPGTQHILHLKFEQR